MWQYQVSFGEAIKRAFSNYCNFRGRASRSEYWWFFLFTFLVSAVLGVPGYVAVFKNALAGSTDVSAFSGWSSLSYLWALVVFLPSFGLLFRRLHDSGRSGWNWLWSFLPFIGAIILLVYLCTESQPFPNKYGDVPNMEEKIY